MHSLLLYVCFNNVTTDKKCLYMYINNSNIVKSSSPATLYFRDLWRGLTMAALMRSPSVSSVVIQAGLIDQKRQNKILMVYNSQDHTRRISSSALLIKSSIENKIFEDQASGIICYKNESGEIICEGYDEGPRLHRKVSSNSYQERTTIGAESVEQLTDSEVDRVDDSTTEQTDGRVDRIDNRSTPESTTGRTRSGDLEIGIWLCEEAQIINILEQSWLNIIDEDGLRQAGKTFAAIEGIDWKALRDTH
ncbi:hypothetical protein Sjap_012032 [Stephania japonica]|uniref:Uncharacterized protein n=1 Tax=Stephania japonica TaxID=461633 RepID=A0AAP0P7X8_9MAGN